MLHLLFRLVQDALQALHFASHVHLLHDMPLQFQTEEELDLMRQATKIVMERSHLLSELNLPQFAALMRSHQRAPQLKEAHCLLFCPIS